MNGRLVLALLLAPLSCRGGATTGGAPQGQGASVGSDAAAEAQPDAHAPDPRVDDLWDSAADGEVADLARLHDREGDRGLLDRAAWPPYRATAIRALAYGDDFTALPFLAGVALSGTDAEADAALESARTLAAVPRRTRDPEDAEELRQGCESLLVLARAVDAPRGRRAGAVSALRMLEGTGCLHGTAEAVPADLGAK